MEPAAGAPLTPRGMEEVRAAARRLARQNFDAIYASEGTGAHQTADLLGTALRLKVRIDADLREIDYGLWQGLKLEEIKRRQPRVYRQWTEAPTTVCPPGGETLTEAQQRIGKAVKEIVKRHKGEAPLVVLPPVVLELLRCLLEEADPGTIWRRMPTGLTWSSYETQNAHL